jgi:hypothetical protein
MNIKEAKIQTENAVKAYLLKDKYGRYKTDRVRQRPVLIIGAPGIGKTAIMEQIAAELGIGLVSYSMTHHTRQSAIGLPYIEKREFEGKEYSVSEYTMSEIIASVHNYIKSTGIKEGILFLDEINCISETLSPAMLQFLQYKTFGNTPVPEGWVIVTAGNPPEFNKSVREFDVATLDRVKKINVEPNYEVWREYAVQKGVHNAIITYLDVKKDNFYVIETTVDGKSFVTARGWEDLSQMIQLYEEMGTEVDQSLIEQYIQHHETARDFALYYELYSKYKTDYKVLDILEGKYDKALVQRAKKAGFDERITLISLLADTINGKMKEVLWEEECTEGVFEVLKEVKTECGDKKNEGTLLEILRDKEQGKKQELENRLISGILGRKDESLMREVIESLDIYIEETAKKALSDRKKAFAAVKKLFDARLAGLDEMSEGTVEMLDNMLDFINEVFGQGQEMALIIAQLTSGNYSARFISRYGSEKYFENSRQMMFYERQKDIMQQIDRLDSLEKEQ